jgi:hypothetical protein
MTIAFIHPALGALIAPGADHVGRLELDQLLHHQTHRVTDQVNAITSTQRREQLRQGRLI